MLFEITILRHSFKESIFSEHSLSTGISKRGVEKTKEMSLKFSSKFNKIKNIYSGNSLRCLETSFFSGYDELKLWE